MLGNMAPGDEVFDILFDRILIGYWSRFGCYN
jgi:hypothetical protein